MINHGVDADVIYRAMTYWRNRGFIPMRVPMCVGKKAMAHTAPPGAQDHRYLHVDGDFYVASSEQSFLQMENRGQLNMVPGRSQYMALTPCFRGMEADDTHYDIFLKLELFAVPESDDKESGEMLACELAFQSKDLLEVLGELDSDRLKVVDTDIGFDVEYNGLELGSFGTRQTITGKWYVYGTGLAEPRYSLAVELSE